MSSKTADVRDTGARAPVQETPEADGMPERSGALHAPLTARGQLTRQKLLDAAESVFGERGYERASITDITQGAGVAQGTFYVYFPDKRSVFTELVRELSHRVRRAIAEAVVGVTDRLEVERLGFRAFFAFVHGHRNLYRIIRQAEFVDEEVFRWYYRRMAEGYMEGLRGAVGSGRLRQLDVETLAYCLMGMTDYLGMRWVLWEGRCPPDEVIDNMMVFVRSGIENTPKNS